jgi:hypothetical protein
MFIYHPPKGSCWGHALRPKIADFAASKQRVRDFLAVYFDVVEHTADDHFTVCWKEAALPGVQWPEEFLGPENQKDREILFLFFGDRVSFISGLFIPISTSEQSSYEFIRQFSRSAPFKMSAKNFSVTVRTGKKARLTSRKPDADIVARLESVLV